MESLNNPNLLDRQHPNIIDTKKFGYAATCEPMAAAGTDDEKDVAIRCRVFTKIYAGGNSKAFADSIGIGKTRWNNIEGSGKLSVDVARHIWRKYPEASLDWLYRGKDDGLTTPRSKELEAAFRAVAREKAPAHRRAS